jgi:ribosomal protein L7/L12
MIVGALVVATLLARVASANRHVGTLSRLEGKLDALLKHEGIRYDPYADVPPAVLDALRRGRKVEAIKEYRAATGTGLKEAKDYVEALQRRAGTRG